MPHDWPGLTDAQWREIAWVLPKKPRKPFLKRKRKGGRPRADPKKIFEAILWTVIGPGRFERLPERFGKRRTVLRRLPRWLVNGWLHKLLENYLAQLTPAERLAWSEAFQRRTLDEPLWWGLLHEHAKSAFPEEFPRRSAANPE